MAQGRPVISHVVIGCFEFRRMLDYYTGILGFQLSDIGKIGDNDIAFLTFDPQAEHHQLALTGGRKGKVGEGALNHVCFRLAAYADLQARHRQLAARGAAGIRLTHHGSWLSVYSQDPEDNRIEFRWDMPWYCGQPYGKPLDLSLSEEAIKRATIEANRDNPRFKTIEAWRADAEARLAGTESTEV
jgi:catechol 2,3-dioxygenase-like lactoylglutathione lyase family enzyme